MRVLSNATWPNHFQKSGMLGVGDRKCCQDVIIKMEAQIDNRTSTSKAYHLCKPANLLPLNPVLSRPWPWKYEHPQGSHLWSHCCHPLAVPKLVWTTWPQPPSTPTETSENGTWNTRIWHWKWRIRAVFGTARQANENVGKRCRQN